jgi:acetyl esterase/lipase
MVVFAQKAQWINPAKVTFDSKTTYLYAQKDTSRLYMDVYLPQPTDKKLPCMIYVFGGGFMTGERDLKHQLPYYKTLVDSGFVVVAIDYRLGLKNQDEKSYRRPNVRRNAVNMAVEDLFSATRYIVDNADKWNIDTAKIIISGSSAGAITVLQADYELANRTALAQGMPNNFRYAGVISFSGALLTHQATLNYARFPSPILLFHGTGDKLVASGKITVLNRSWMGSAAIAETFKKKGYPYYLYTYRNLGHEIAVVPMYENKAEIFSFIRTFIDQGKDLQIEQTYFDKDRKKLFDINPKEFYKRNKK